MTNDVENFHVLICLPYVFFNIFCLFYWIVCFSYGVIGIFNIVCIQVLYQIYVLQIFSHNL